jgi:hypothetical protein
MFLLGCQKIIKFIVNFHSRQREAEYKSLGYKPGEKYITMYHR